MSTVDYLLDYWQANAIFKPPRVSLSDIKTTNCVVELRLQPEQLKDYKSTYAELEGVSRNLQSMAAIELKTRYVAKHAKPKTVVLGTPELLKAVHAIFDANNHPHHMDTADEFDLLLTSDLHEGDHYIFLEIIPIETFLKHTNAVMLMIHDTYDAVRLSEELDRYPIPASFQLSDIVLGETYGDRILRTAAKLKVTPHGVRRVCDAAFRQQIRRKQLNLHCDPKDFRRFEDAPWETHFIPKEAIRRIMRGGLRAKETAQAWGLTQAEVLAACAQKLERKIEYILCDYGRQLILESWRRECKNTAALDAALAIDHEVPIPAHVKMPPLKCDHDRAVTQLSVICYLGSMVQWLGKEELEAAKNKRTTEAGIHNRTED